MSYVFNVFINGQFVLYYSSSDNDLIFIKTLHFKKAFGWPLSDQI
jgi:hypothetical protein